MSIVKSGISFGKDSTCAACLHIEQGDTVKGVCYIPMFNDTIPLLTKVHYDHIMKTAERLRSMGAEITFVYGISYYDYVHKRSTRGKYKGMAFGFPQFVRSHCGFKRDSKLKAILGCDVGEYDYEDIGIAADETHRLHQLNEQKRSILVEQGYTGAMTLQYCRARNLLSPHYLRNGRDGCVLCPFSKEEERQEWFNDYPEVVPLVIELQEFVKKERPEQTPLRGYKWFIEV